MNWKEFLKQYGLDPDATRQRSEEIGGGHVSGQYPVADAAGKALLGLASYYAPITEERAREIAPQSALDVFDNSTGGSLAIAPLAKKGALNKISTMTEQERKIAEFAKKLGLELEPTSIVGKNELWTPTWSKNKIQYTPDAPDIFSADHEIAHTLMTKPGMSLADYSKEIPLSSHFVTSQLEEALAKRLGYKAEPSLTSLNEYVMDHLISPEEWVKAQTQLPIGLRNPYEKLKISPDEAKKEIDFLKQHFKPQVDDILSRIDSGQLKFTKDGVLDNSLGEIQTKALEKIKKPGIPYSQIFQGEDAIKQIEKSPAPLFDRNLKDWEQYRPGTQNILDALILSKKKGN